MSTLNVKLFLPHQKKHKRRHEIPNKIKNKNPQKGILRETSTYIYLNSKDRRPSVILREVSCFYLLFLNYVLPFKNLYKNMTNFLLVKLYRMCNFLLLSRRSQFISILAFCPIPLLSVNVNLNLN